MYLRILLPCLMALCLATPLLAQGNQRGNAEVTIKGKKISINYGRPSLQGRDMLSKATTGTVWRLGMNQATEIETTGDLVIGKTRLKAGKYSLWAKKTGDKNWVLAFHPKTGVWGQPELKEGYVAELPLTLTQAASSAEELTISLANQKGKAGIKIHWGSMMLSGAVGVV